MLKIWRVYGVEGHRKRESFNESYSMEFERSFGHVIICVNNHDITGTNEYTEICIQSETATEEDCEKEFFGQLSDGIFENSRIGKIVKIY